MPRALYDEDEIGVGRRLPLMSGLMFGFIMGLFTLLSELRGEASLIQSVGTAALVSTIGGAVFGLLFPPLLGRMASRMNDRLYAGDPSLVPPPEDGAYSLRLPCGWMRTPNHAVGGVLYLGRRGMRFDAHLATPAAFRQTLLFEPLERLDLELVEATLPIVARLFTGRRSIQRLQLRDGSRTAVFGIPQAATVLARLQEQSQVLRSADRPGPSDREAHA